MRIKSILRQKNLTAKELAAKIGVTEATMSNIINGKGNPGLDKYKAIAVVLDVNFEELFVEPCSDAITCPYCGNVIKLNPEKGGDE